jgi:GNAT superfamily N-acetyltransferase
MERGMIELAATDKQIAACFDVMALLRPKLQRAEFVNHIRHLQMTTGLRLAYVSEGEIKCAAGFRISEWLAGGRYLEVEDLVTDRAARSHGYGGRLFDWLVRLAELEKCDHIRLISGVHRVDAHRFYKRKGMIKEAFYYSMRLET